MKNKKAFTLIELIAVVLIIGFLLLLAVPNVRRYYMKGTKTYYQSLEKTVLLAGRDYFNDYRSLLPREIGNVTVVELDELKGNKYIEKVVDKNNKECSVKVTAKKIAKGKYEYYSCLICEDYESEEENCGYTEETNVTLETKNYEVVVEDNGMYELDVNGKYIVDQGEKIDLPKGKAYYKGELVTSEVLPLPREVDTTKLGEVTVVYWYHGAKKEIIVKVIDRKKPSKPQIVMKKNNINGNVYKSGWFSGNIYQEFKSTDIVKQGLNGSGIDHYEVDTGSGFKRISGNSITNSSDGDYTYKVRSVDRSNNRSDVSTYNFKIDKTKPECSLEIVSGTIGKMPDGTNTSWYISNVEIRFSKLDGTVSNVVSSVVTDYVNGVVVGQKSLPTTVSNTNEEQYKYTLTVDNQHTIIGTLVDEAGNTNTCSININVDKGNPTISAKQANTYIWYPTDAAPTNYFNISYSVSSGSTSCTVSNVNQLGFGVNTVTCVTTGGNGKQVSASTVFRHQYTGTAQCSNGRTLENGNCTYWDSGCGDCNGWRDTTCKTWVDDTSSCKTWVDNTSSCKTKKYCTKSYKCQKSCSVSGYMNGCPSGMTGSCNHHQGDPMPKCDCSGTCEETCYSKYECGCDEYNKKCGEYNKKCSEYNKECISHVGCTRTDNGSRYYICPSGGSLISGTSTCQF